MAIWKTIAVNAAITILLLLAGSMALLPRDPATRDEIRETVASTVKPLEDRLAALEAKAAKPDLRQSPHAVPSAPLLPEGRKQQGEPGRVQGGPFGWVQDLPAAKQAAVKEIFREQGRRLRETLADKSPGRQADPNLMREAMAQNQEELDDKLRAVLSPEEYQMYLSSRPNPGFGKRDGTPPGAGGK